MANRRVNDGFRWKDSREVFDTFLNICFGQPGLASGLAPTVSCSYALVYTISGYVYSAAAGATGIASVTGNTLAAQASGTYCLYALGINSAGSIFAMKGEEKPIASYDSVSVFLPAVPTSLCFIGYILCSTLSNASWSCGVSAITASIHTIKPCAMIPQGVIIST